MNIKLLKTMKLIQGDEKTIKISFELEGEELDFSNYKGRFTIKDYRNAKTPMSDYILAKSGLLVNKNFIEIKLLPEETAKFPITKPNKPLVLAVGIYNKDEKYSREWHFGLEVTPMVNNNIY